MTDKSNKSREIQMVALPRHMKLSEDEMVLVSRLVRVHRAPGYWLSGFLEWLLAEDAVCESSCLDLDYALEILKKIQALRSWNDFLTEESSLPIRRYFGHKFFPGDVDRIVDDRFSADQSKEVVDLVNLWRKSYPEPPKRRRIPAGHLDCEESGD